MGLTGQVLVGEVVEREASYRPAHRAELLVMSNDADSFATYEGNSSALTERFKELSS
jgi:hypothetical protein